MSSDNEIVKESVSEELEYTNEIVKESEPVVCDSDKMIPSFSQCRPIEKSSDIEECILNPPEWVDRVLPLKKRCGYVIKNTLSDCHSDEDQFSIRGRIDSRTVPKTLVCHDYKGGYLSDSYIPFEGGEDKTFATDGYTFYNWSQIDYFVYFSHYFITIPPLAWINAGHKNGVKVLGTIITEFSNGVKICDEELFKNRDQMREFVYQLIELTSIFRFDGWLLNIENEVKNPDILLEFVDLFTKKIHERNSENVVIWYDSVTRDGKLKWQDQLNIENRCFFDCCDGIFLNYCWNEQKLMDTVHFAGPRHFDVFVGIDVFGRNMFGGGEFNTYKAAELISRYNLSMAIFAPGWTHEVMEKLPKETLFSRFLNRDDALWTSLWPYFYTHPVNNYFETDFHVGLDAKYYNLFIQKQQTSKILHPENLNVIPSHATIKTLFSSCNCLSRGYFEGKNTCVISKENLRFSRTDFVHHIFACDIKLSGNIGVYYLTNKLNGLDSAGLSLTLLTSLNSGACRKIILSGKPKPDRLNTISLLEVNPLREHEVKYIFPLNTVAKRHMRMLNSPKYVDTLVLSMFEFTTTACSLLEIGATVRNGKAIHLLEFGIVPLR